MRLNDESRAETGELIHHDTSGSDAMAEHLEEEVGLHTESGAVDVDTNYDASEVLEEPVEVETPVRRTMIDMFRNGTDETALAAVALYCTYCTYARTVLTYRIDLSYTYCTYIPYSFSPSRI